MSNINVDAAVGLVVSATGTTSVETLWGATVRVLVHAADQEVVRAVAAQRVELERLAENAVAAQTGPLAALVAAHVRAASVAGVAGVAQHGGPGPAPAHATLARLVRLAGLVALRLPALAFTDAPSSVALGLASAVAQAADTLRRPALAVLALRRLLDHPSVHDAADGHTLTRIHALFLRTAIAAKAHALALPVVLRPLTRIDRTLVAPSDVALYAYYAAIICAALKHFDRAVAFCRMALAVPANALSQIQLEAWRKGVLCYLLANGKASDESSASSNVSWKSFEKLGLARFVSPIVSKLIDQGGYKKPYIDFCNACEKGIWADANAELIKHASLFQKSGNLGLAKQCVGAALAKRRILRLTKTYITLSVPDIWRAVADAFPPSTTATNPDGGLVLIKRYIRQLIASGQVHATIDESIPGTMVQFHDHVATFADIESMDLLDSLMKNVIAVHSRVSDMDQNIALSKEYLSKTLLNEGAGGIGGGKDKNTRKYAGNIGGLGGGGGSFSDFNGGFDGGFDEDVDIMMDDY
ncbi:hypothetical protein HK100_009240 [Physocladia obscura]|uniref:COP9 signalosome complex subunit 3 N-terminal helical repeats domain-containing protein n=1 Tax=Physocladia obscura TaxID=109957 RepID=A0AAD5T3E9_9FUNG|nr:hypothetical protein HK100_009240 [Physocladia obscura]